MAYHVTVICPAALETEVTKLSEVASVNRVVKAALDDGRLEIVPHFETYGRERCVAFCDEEGKLKGLPMNPRATYLWYACLAPAAFRPDTLNGPVVIVTADTEQELQAL